MNFPIEIITDLGANGITLFMLWYFMQQNKELNTRLFELFRKNLVSMSRLTKAIRKHGIKVDIEIEEETDGESV